MSSTPPSLAPVAWAWVQVVPLVEVSMRYALPYAASHVSLTRDTVTVLPRSTWIHCGSANWLDQRVEALPSTALAAAYPPPSTEEAVAALPREMGNSSAAAGMANTTAPAASVMP